LDSHTLKMISYLMLGLSFSLVLIKVYFFFDFSINMEIRIKNFILLIINGVASLTITSFNKNKLLDSFPTVFQYAIVVILSVIVLGTLIEQMKNYFYIK